MSQHRYKIVYEDDWIIVVDKPSGLLVIPTPKKETNTLTDLLNEELDRRAFASRAYPCHRIDRDTSGLIIYAKGKTVQQLIMAQFQNRTIKKCYIAFVNGVVTKSHGIIKRPIFNRNKKRRDPAETKYNVLERQKDFSVLEVMPITGRTNQIRIHFKDIGHPLVGERVYAFRKDFKLRFKRAALHAAKIEFTHPMTSKISIFQSPLPDDMRIFYDKYRRIA